jgi:hypothetical protein
MVAPEAGQRPVGGAGELGVAKEDPPLGRLVERPEDVEERRLARARGPEQHDHLALDELDVDAAQGMHGRGAGAVDLGDAFRAEDRARRSQSGSAPTCGSTASAWGARSSASAGPVSTATVTMPAARAGVQIVGAVADHRDLGGHRGRMAAEGLEHAGARLGAEARIVARDEVEAAEHADLGELGAGRRLGVVGRDPEREPPGAQLVEQRRERRRLDGPHRRRR